MPVYRIDCSEVRCRWLVVEAPSREALDKYYQESDGEEFCSGDEEWALDEIAECKPEPDGSYLDSINLAIDEEGERDEKATADCLAREGRLLVARHAREELRKSDARLKERLAVEREAAEGGVA